MECGDTEEVLLVESPHPDDAVVPVEVLGGAALGGFLGLALALGMQYLINRASCEVGVHMLEARPGAAMS